jgi:hypothetical protein
VPGVAKGMATGVANETVGKLIASSSIEIKYLKFILAFLLKNKKLTLINLCVNWA